MYEGEMEEIVRKLKLGDVDVQKAFPSRKEKKAAQKEDCMEKARAAPIIIEDWALSGWVCAYIYYAFYLIIPPSHAYFPAFQPMIEVSGPVGQFLHEKVTIYLMPLPYHFHS